MKVKIEDLLLRLEQENQRQFDFLSCIKFYKLIFAELKQNKTIAET